MFRFAADILEGRTKEDEYTEPVLYKEWRFEGEVSGTGFFKAGITAEQIFLVFQGGVRAASRSVKKVGKTKTEVSK